MLSALPETPPLTNLGTKEQVVWDYALKSFNEWGVHPIDLMRQELTSLGATPMARLPKQGYVTTAGQVVSKQKPPTAKDYAFFDIEDGPQRAQIIISPALGDTHRAMLVEVRVLLVSGWLEKRGKAWTIRAEKIVDPFAGQLLLD